MTLPPVVVLTPRYPGPAQRIGDRTWRKLVLPVGDVMHGGKALHFTASYISELAGAFRNRAYDYIPVQLGNGLDPEDFGGHITDVEAGPDGLYAVIRATERGDRILAADPRLPLSARITENYGRSDGQFFGAALQSVASGQAIGLSNGPQAYIDLSGSSWAGEPGPSFGLAASAVAARLPSAPQAGPYDDIDAIIQASLPAGYGTSYDLSAAYSEFGTAFELANVTESTRLEQDEARDAAMRGANPPTAEERLRDGLARWADGTYTPRGPAAYGFASPAHASLTGLGTCDVSDDLGYCRATHHQPGCGSAVGPDITEALRPAMEQMTARPYPDADGRVWADQEFGAPMSLLDHVEARTGQRLGDASLWEHDLRDARGNRRELAAVARPVVYGDPDIPGSAQPFPASTARTAAAFAAQRGIPTWASTGAQRDAYRAEHARQKARLGKPRSMDYAAELSNPAPRETGPVEFGDAPWNGSLQTFTAGAR